MITADSDSLLGGNSSLDMLCYFIWTQTVANVAGFANSTIENVASIVWAELEGARPADKNKKPWWMRKFLEGDGLDGSDIHSMLAPTARADRTAHSHRLRISTLAAYNCTSPSYPF